MGVSRAKNNEFSFICIWGYASSLWSSLKRDEYELFNFSSRIQKCRTEKELKSIEKIQYFFMQAFLPGEEIIIEMKEHAFQFYEVSKHFL